MERITLQRLLDLQKLLLQFSQIERHIKRRHHGTYVSENDTEHSYSLTITAWFLARQFPELDVDTVIRFALVHDLIEIHAGDTFAYGTPDVLESKQAREAAALQRLAVEWPDFEDLILTIEEYEKRDSAEGRFIYALDKIMAPMQVLINEGKSWQEEGVTLEKLHATKAQR